jgi:hypothetical protein
MKFSNEWKHKKVKNMFAATPVCCLSAKGTAASLAGNGELQQDFQVGFGIC